MICARPKVRARTAAGVQACTREPTQRQRLADGAPNFLWAIKPLQGPPPRPKADTEEEREVDSVEA